MRKLILQTERLMVGTWDWGDLEWFAEMNADPEVMKYFPHPLDIQESRTFLKKLLDHFHSKGYTYFPIFLNETYQPVGFAGFKYQDYESPYTPAVDIGYRFLSDQWGNGYATEACEALLIQAPRKWNFRRVISVTPKSNIASQNVMQKIGMEFIGLINHPNLEDYPEIKQCVVYEKNLL